MKALKLYGLAVSAALVVAIGLPQDIAGPAWAQEDSPEIPAFWDPKRRIERPPAGSVTAIRFVTTADFPPFSFLNEDGHLTGFNVDLAREICAQLNISCTVQTREWDDLLRALREDKADAIIAGLAITAESREEIDFSESYLRLPGRFVVRSDTEPFSLTPDGLTGKTLAVVSRTAHEAYLAAFFPEVGRRLYPDERAAREALKSGEVDAHFGDGIALSFWLQSEAAGDCCRFAGGPYMESRFFGEGMAVAVRRGENDLNQGIDSALASIFADGTYAELYLRYFPVSFY